MMKKQHELTLLLVLALVFGLSSAMGWACDDEHSDATTEAQPASEKLQESKVAPREPIVRLEVAIKSPDGILEPGTYYTHPLLTEEGFTELTLSKDDRVVTRFALRPAQSEPSPITPATGFPVIHTEATLTEDQKSVIFTVFEGPDRYLSSPFPIVSDRTP